MEMRRVLSQDLNPLSLSSDPDGKPKKKRTKIARTGDCSAGVVIPTPRKGKPDRGAPNITPPCSECGKRFWSWKALFGHMRCHPERQWRGINPPENLQGEVGAVVGGEPSCFTAEDREVASWLLMLANEPPADQSPSLVTTTQPAAAPENLSEEEKETTLAVEAASFECSSCKKVFSSHQALGGHRATHKNVKGCHAITKNDGEDEIGGVWSEAASPLIKTGHKCGICLRVFSTGQALGGHMRCHWEKSQTEPPPPLSLAAGFDLNLNADRSCFRSPKDITLDLRLGLGL